MPPSASKRTGLPVVWTVLLLALQVESARERYTSGKLELGTQDEGSNPDTSAGRGDSDHWWCLDPAPNTLAELIHRMNVPSTALHELPEMFTQLVANMQFVDSDTSGNRCGNVVSPCKHYFFLDESGVAHPCRSKFTRSEGESYCRDRTYWTGTQIECPQIRKKWTRIFHEQLECPHSKDTIGSLIKQAKYLAEHHGFSPFQQFDSMQSNQEFLNHTVVQDGDYLRALRVHNGSHENMEQNGFSKRVLKNWDATLQDLHAELTMNENIGRSSKFTDQQRLEYAEHLLSQERRRLESITAFVTDLEDFVSPFRSWEVQGITRSYKPQKLDGPAAFASAAYTLRLQQWVNACELAALL